MASPGREIILNSTSSSTHSTLKSSSSENFPVALKRTCQNLSNSIGDSAIFLRSSLSDTNPLLTFRNALEIVSNEQTKRFIPWFMTRKYHSNKYNSISTFHQLFSRSDFRRHNEPPLASYSCLSRHSYLCELWGH
jgi:hypothetical protein